ncbi:MAG: hypothetical protein P4L83_10860 [Nevskia sp.]|nr:hypothetical protein [Nevskia sp.]
MHKFAACAAGLGAMLLLAWWAYAPGLHGAFLFDDFNNLSQLGAYGRVDNFRTLLFYLSSGNADPVGRPLSLLSFLLDADNWPAAPTPFKHTNLLLHLLNGVLLALLLRRLGRRLGCSEGRALAAALLGATLWTLHPLLVSTTLYVVQREAMLPATLTLLGMLLWLDGGERLQQGRRFALARMVAGAWACTVLAVLCKANGVLLPLLLLVMEWTLPECEPRPERTLAVRRSRIVLLVIPSALLALWLLAKLPAAFTGETYGRPWTVGQRLLTEPRVLASYLSSLWLPRASNSSLFNDAFRPSTGWLQPAATLPCLIGVLALLGAGLALRRRHPALSFAILFYFAGQLLESTVIQLELYFEHRNYLPALPMFWPLALWLTGSGGLIAVRRGLAMLLPLLLAGLCHSRAVLWGAPYEQALLLAASDAASPRAQANAASYEVAHGRAGLAVKRLTEATARKPDEAQLALNLVSAECAAGGATPAALEAARYALSHNVEQAELVQRWLVGSIALAARGGCRGLDLDTIASLVASMRANPHYSKGAGHSRDVEELEARLSLAHGDGQAALRHLDAGLRLSPTPDGALVDAALLGSAGFPALGLQHLDLYRTLPPAYRGLHGMPALHLWLLERGGYWTAEFRHMENQLRQDAADQPPHPSRPPSS